MCSDEQAKAAQEVAKTVRQALPLARDFGSFVAKVVGGPLEQAAGIVEDRLKYMRLERQMRLMQQVEELQRALGQERSVKPVPLKVAVPLLQAATLEDDNALQDRWASLLVNAMDPMSSVEVGKHFVSILGEFGPLEAVLLEKIVDAPENAGTGGSVWTERLPKGYILNASKSEHGEPPESVELALWNLVRLGCVSTTATWGGGNSVQLVRATVLGRRMVEACRLRSEPTSCTGEVD